MSVCAKFQLSRSSRSAWKVSVGGGWVGWGLQSHFHVKPNRCVEVRLGFWQYLSLPKLSGLTGACSDYLGSFGKRDQPFGNFFTAKKSSREVGPPSQNNLRYLSLPRLIGFTSACRAIKPKQVKPKKLQLMKKKALKRRKLID